MRVVATCPSSLVLLARCVLPVDPCACVLSTPRRSCLRPAPSFFKNFLSCVSSHRAGAYRYALGHCRLQRMVATAAWTDGAMHFLGCHAWSLVGSRARCAILISLPPYPASAFSPRAARAYPARRIGIVVAAHARRPRACLLESRDVRDRAANFLSDRQEGDTVRFRLIFNTKKVLHVPSGKTHPALRRGRWSDLPVPTPRAGST